MAVRRLRWLAFRAGVGAGIAVVVVLAALGSSAHAKVPGGNGQLVYVHFSPTVGDDTTYIVNPGGGNPQPVLPGMQTTTPHWSPDGSELALMTGDDNPCPPCASSTIILNPDTGSSRVLSPPDPNLSTGCSLWSPDGSHFACSGENDSGSANGMYTIRTTDGGGLTRITNAGGVELIDIPIDYSPDGTRIVFGRVSSDNHSCTKRSALYVVNIDGSGLHRITPFGFCDDDGSWSPDGTEIAFASSAGRQSSNIYLVHPDGTALRQLPIKVPPGDGFADISWSPDGGKLSFSLGGPSTPEGIFTANANGTDLQRVTTSPNFDHEVD
jgi:Tol biopolymer transport system component